MPRRTEPRIPDAVLDQLLAGADPQAVCDPNGLLDALKTALAERVRNAEMDHPLAGEEPGSRRNGYGKKTVMTDTGQIVLEAVAAWQARPLEPVDPLIVVDARRVNIRAEGLVRNKARHLALGVRADGTKEILGLWRAQNEAAKVCPRA